MKKECLKLICVNDRNIFEFEVVEDINRGALSEIHEFIDKNFHKHIGCKWILIPMQISDDIIK